MLSLLTVLPVLLLTSRAQAWGAVGHEAVGYVNIQYNHSLPCGALNEFISPQICRHGRKWFQALVSCLAYPDSSSLFEVFVRGRA